MASEYTKDQQSEDFCLRRRGSKTRLINFKGELEEALSSYCTETLDHILKVKGLSEWINARKRELEKIKDIERRADNVRKEFWFWQHLAISGRQEELRKELDVVLKDTLRGLEKLYDFMVTVEKLAVTSCHVFEEKKGAVFDLPAGVSLQCIQSVVTGAHNISSLLFLDKAEVSKSFTPRLKNLDVISHQLNEYIQKTQRIYDRLEIRHFPLGRSTETKVRLCGKFTDDEMERMLTVIQQLVEIRTHQDSIKEIRGELEDRKPGMSQSLKYLEEVAVKLDSMKKGSKISSVVSSSVGVAGSVLTIAGVALSPVTAGASLALTGVGVGLGVTSGVTTAVAATAEIGVNKTQQKRAEEIFKSYMKKSERLRELSQGMGLGGVTGDGVGRSAIGDLDLSALGPLCKAAGSILKNDDLVVHAATKGSLTLFKSARAGVIGLNFLSIGVDLYSMYKDGMSLAEGSETEMSKSIRALAADLSSELESWQKTCDFFTSLPNKPFYSEK